MKGNHYPDPGVQFGHFRVLPCTTGGYVVIDDRRAPGYQRRGTRRARRRGSTMSYATKKEINERTCACGYFVPYGQGHACDLGCVPPDRAKQPCPKCGAETKNKKACPACAAPVIYVAPSKKAKPPLESKIKAEIRAAITRAGVLAWVHNVDNRFLSTGLGLGTSDLICVVPPYGRFLGIEIKRPGYEPSRVSEDQRAWLAVVRQFGGVTGIATNVAEALALVHEARQESRIDVEPRAT